MARRRTTAVATVPLTLPDIAGPPKSEAELARERFYKEETRRLLDSISDNLTQQNLNRAVKLAQMAARREGPLVKFFEEVGFKYREWADKGAVVEGVVAAKPRQLARDSRRADS